MTVDTENHPGALLENNKDDSITIMNFISNIENPALWVGIFIFRKIQSIYLKASL